MITINGYWQALKRRKQLTSDESDTNLARVLNLFDLTALGVGSTLGLGVYVLAGKVAYEHAGPAVTISFLIAALASGIAAMCYAEFAARVPKAGSAYVYTYVTVGEFLAFTIGWNLILEYIIGTSSVARGLSGYLDTLIGHEMSRIFKTVLPMDVSFLAQYPDMFAFLMIILLACLLSTGVKESSLLNNIFTAINVTTVVIVVASGIFKADVNNWTIRKEDIPEQYEKHGGEGGFMPYGVAGIMAGAAQCFYGFVGFDCLATTGEEAINPRRNIPLSILLSLIIIFLSYFGVSTALTLMWPYYDLGADAPFPYVYGKIGWIEIKWVVSIGAIFALSTSLLGAMFPLPRVIYAMASDGLLYDIFKRVNERTHTPVIATLLSGLLAAILALLLDLQQLIEMMSLGTLMAYTIVAACILLLRYQNDEQILYLEKSTLTPPQLYRQILNLNLLKRPNHLSSNIVKVCIVIFSVFSVIICIAIDKYRHHWFGLTAAIASGIILFVLMLIIARQPKIESSDLNVKVPAIPILPLISIFINLYLMCQLESATWIRFAIWITIGYIIYFTYGVRQSIEGNRRKLEFSEHGHICKEYKRPERKNNGTAISKINKTEDAQPVELSELETGCEKNKQPEHCTAIGGDSTAQSVGENS